MPARPVAPPLAIDLGRGVFETVLVVDGEAVALERHLRRLARSAADVFGAPLPAQLAERARADANGHGRARLRITAVPREGGVDVVVEAEPLEPDAQRPVVLDPVVLPGGLGEHKWRDRTAVDELEHRAAPALPLLVDGNGEVLETTRSNVFVVRDGVVATPPADGRLLPGVTRERVLVAAAAAGIPAIERPIEVDELADADEVFVTSALAGLRSVEARGPVGAALAHALEDVR